MSVHTRKIGTCPNFIVAFLNEFIEKILEKCEKNVLARRRVFADLFIIIIFS